MKNMASFVTSSSPLVYMCFFSALFPPLFISTSSVLLYTSLQELEELAECDPDDSSMPPSMRSVTFLTKWPGKN